MGSSIVLSDIGNKLSQEDADFERQNVADLLGRASISFPGAQPVSFARRHLNELRQIDYFMCEKTDGVRCLLYLTEVNFGDGPREAYFLIDRKNDYYYIPDNNLHLPQPNDFASYHRGTVLDGELVLQQPKNAPKRLAYLIFDCLAIDGHSVMHRGLDKRLIRIDELIVKPLRALAKKYPDDVAAQPFQVEMKSMELSYGMEVMFKDRIPKLPHGNDGIIFTCKDTAYVSGTDQHILKWKPPHENTIDFRLLLGDFPMIEDDEGAYEDWDAKPAFELHVNHGGSGGYKYYAPMHVTDTEWTSMKRMNQQLDGRIIECYRDPNDGWRPKIEKDGTPRFRDDKKDANHISTVDSVIESIEDAVTEDILIREGSSIRTAWKERQKKREEAQKAAEEAERVKRQEEMKRRASEAQSAQSAKEEDDVGPRYED